MITTGTNQLIKSFSDLLRPLRKNEQALPALPFFSVQFSSSICTVQSNNRGRRFRPTSAKYPYFSPKMENKYCFSIRCVSLLSSYPFRNSLSCNFRQQF